jgi:hypothetical protein
VHSDNNFKGFIPSATFLGTAMATLSDFGYEQYSERQNLLSKLIWYILGLEVRRYFATALYMYVRTSGEMA